MLAQLRDLQRRYRRDFKNAIPAETHRPIFGRDFAATNYYRRYRLDLLANADLQRRCRRDFKNAIPAETHRPMFGRDSAAINYYRRCRRDFLANASPVFLQERHAQCRGDQHSALRGMWLWFYPRLLGHSSIAQS